MRFLGAVAERCELQIAVQDPPDYIGISMTNQGLKTLHRNYPNVVAVKAESTALEVAWLIDTSVV